MGSYSCLWLSPSGWLSVPAGGALPLIVRLAVKAREGTGVWKALTTCAFPNAHGSLRLQGATYLLTLDGRQARGAR
jgi:hypothetical protein